VTADPVIEETPVPPDTDFFCQTSLKITNQLGKSFSLPGPYNQMDMVWHPQGNRAKPTMLLVIKFKSADDFLRFFWPAQLIKPLGTATDSHKEIRILDSPRSFMV